MSGRGRGKGVPRGGKHGGGGGRGGTTTVRRVTEKTHVEVKRGKGGGAGRDDGYGGHSYHSKYSGGYNDYSYEYGNEGRWKNRDDEWDQEWGEWDKGWEWDRGERRERRDRGDKGDKDRWGGKWGHGHNPKTTVSRTYEAPPEPSPQSDDEPTDTWTDEQFDLDFKGGAGGPSPGQNFNSRTNLNPNPRSIPTSGLRPNPNPNPIPSSSIRPNTGLNPNTRPNPSLSPSTSIRPNPSLNPNASIRPTPGLLQRPNPNPLLAAGPPPKDDPMNPSKPRRGIIRIPDAAKGEFVASMRRLHQTPPQVPQPVKVPVSPPPAQSLLPPTTYGQQQDLRTEREVHQYHNVNGVIGGAANNTSVQPSFGGNGVDINGIIGMGMNIGMGFGIANRNEGWQGPPSSSSSSSSSSRSSDADGTWAAIARGEQKEPHKPVPRIEQEVENWADDGEEEAVVEDEYCSEPETEWSSEDEEQDNWPDGMYLAEDFLSEVEERNLLSWYKTQSFKHSRSYGHSSTSAPTPAVTRLQNTPLPELPVDLIEAMMCSNSVPRTSRPLEEPPNQLTITQHPFGDLQEGIFHDARVFCNAIAVLSCGAPATCTLTPLPRVTKPAKRIRLTRRSLLMLTGPAMRSYTISMQEPKRRRIHKGERVSFTYRKVRPQIAKEAQDAYDVRYKQAKA